MAIDHHRGVVFHHENVFFYTSQEGGNAHQHCLSRKKILIQDVGCDPGDGCFDLLHSSTREDANPFYSQSFSALFPQLKEGQGVAPSCCLACISRTLDIILIASWT